MKKEKHVLKHKIISTYIRSRERDMSSARENSLLQVKNICSLPEKKTSSVQTNGTVQIVLESVV